MTLTEEEWDELKSDPVFARALGVRYRELRKQLSSKRRRGRETQDSLASDAGITKFTVQRLEQGRASMVGFDTFLSAAKAIGADPDRLVQDARARHGVGGLPAWPRMPSAAPIGRDAERDAVIAELRARVGVILFGAPGQGKTLLARYVGETIGASFRHGVHELDLENERQIENLPRLVMSAIGQLDSASYDGLAGKSVLLILDGIDQLQASPPRLREALNSLIGAMSSDARIIVTAQSKFEKQELATIEVLPLAGPDAVELYHQVSGGVYRSEPGEGVSQFVTGQLACHPLSIRIVARYGSTAGLPLAVIRRLWDERWDAIAEGPAHALDARGLRASFELAFESLPTSSKALFLILALLPDGISADLASSVWGARETEIYEALHLLHDRSLLEEQAVVHGHSRLRGPLYRFAATKLAELKEAGDAVAQEIGDIGREIDEYCDGFVSSFAPQFGDLDTTENNARIRQEFHNIHASLDRRLEPSTDAATVAAAQSVLALYWAYHNNLSGAQNPISSTEDALAYLEKARAVFIGNGRTDDARKCVYYIGNILWLRGDVATAERHFREVRGGDEVDDEMACDIERAFAHIEYKEGSIPAAVEKYQAVIAKANGRFPDCVSRCWVGLLDAYRKLAAFEEGLALYREIAAKLHASPASVAANVYRGHAYLLASAGRLNEGMAEYRRALDAFRHNDFGMAHCWRGIGDILVKQTDFDEADAAFEKAMAHYRDARKVPSLGVALVTLGRARLRMAVGDAAGATDVLRVAAKQLGRKELNEPYELAVAHELLGDALLSSGERERANAEYQIAASYFERVGAFKVAQAVRGKLT